MINRYKWNKLRFKDFLKHAIYVRNEEILTGVKLPKEILHKNDLVLYLYEKNKAEELITMYSDSNFSSLYSIDRIMRYLSINCRCIAVKKNGKFIGHFWWGGPDIVKKNCDPALRYVLETMNIKNGDVFAIDFFIAPEERGSGISLEVFAKACRFLFEKGNTRCLGLVQPHNISARWTYKLLGHKDIDKIVVHRILNYFVMIKGRCYFSPHALSS